MATRQQEIESLAKLMKKIDVAMLSTVGKGGYLVSRPLSTQTVQFDGERIWFVTAADSPKVAEIKRNGKVNVAYASKDANTYIPAAGDAVVRADQGRDHAFWHAANKAILHNTGNDDLMGENRIIDLGSGRSAKPPGSDRPGTRSAPNPAKSAAKQTAKKTAKNAASKPTTSTPATKAKKAATTTRSSTAAGKPKKATRKTAARKSS